MAWARLDDGFHDHPKVDGLPLAAVGLYALCLTWAHRHRRTAARHGHITEARVRKLAGKQATSLSGHLVRAGLWEPEAALGGWIIHDFGDYLPKQRDPEELAEAGRRGGQAKASKVKQAASSLLPDSHDSASNQPPAGVANPGSRASAPAYPSRPVPKSESKEGGDRYVTPRPGDATSPPTCSQHPDGDSDQPCSGCQRVREWRYRCEADAKNRAKEAARNCPDCGGTGWLESPDTALPAGRCTHPRSRRTA